MATKPKPKEKAVTDRAKALKAAIAEIEVMDATLEARARARKLMTENGDMWRASYEVADGALVVWIEAMQATGLTKELYTLECKRLKQELLTDKDGPLEKLLIGQVVLAWVRLMYIDQFYTAVFSGKEGVTFERGLFWEKRLTMAQKRFDQATVALARVRRLLQGSKVKNLNVAVFNPLPVSSANTDAAVRAYDRRR